VVKASGLANNWAALATLVGASWLASPGLEGGLDQDMSPESTDVVEEVMEVAQDQGMTIVAVIPKDQNLHPIDLPT
jgi:hypothetical protein